jgi:hypothetical protein
MTQEEMGATISRLESSVSSLTEEWTEFLKVETQKREREDSKAIQEVEDWQKKQTFLNKHGAKIATFLFAAVSSGLAWYGSQIRSEIAAEQRAEEVDKSIQSNKSTFETFKKEEFQPVKEDIQELQLDSVDQTIMIDKGFDRLDKTIIKAHPRQFPDEDALPPPDPAFRKAADDAART